MREGYLRKCTSRFIKTISMKKENIDLFRWAIAIRSAIKNAKGGGIGVCSNVLEVNSPFINSICDICNEAIEKIENEIEKLD